MKTCPICYNAFKAFNTLQKTCSQIKCAVEYVRRKRAKKQKAETRKMRSEFNAKDKSHQLKLAQAAFNSFIRSRDPQSSGCISCGSTTGKWTAGHYKTDKSLRFVEDNVHGQCWFNCNSNRSGNIAEYRPRLVDKIGLERVEYLEKYHPPKNYTLEEIIAIKLEYRAKLKPLQSE